MDIPHPETNNLEAFQNQMHAAIKVASATEINDAVVRAAQFIENLFDKVPSSVFGDENEVYTHLNNATATICVGVNKLANELASEQA